MDSKRYLFPADYMADPSVHVFNDRLYIYPSHDIDSTSAESDKGDQYVMRDSHVLSTSDPLHGEVVDHGVALSIDDIPWAGRQLWDSDVAEKDGKYYLYFPLKDKNDIFRTGVAIADRPEGPFVPQPDPIRGSYSIDYCVLKIEDDYYMYFGGLWGGQLQRYKDNHALEKPYLPSGDEPALPSRVVKLSKDMLQFAEEPRPVYVVDKDGHPLKASDPHRFFEASWVHFYNGLYYFSWATLTSQLLCYGTSPSPFGPFTYQGVILTPVEGLTSHHSIVQYHGKWYLFFHDCGPSGGRSWLRSLRVCELHYDDEGHIITIQGKDHD